MCMHLARTATNHALTNAVAAAICVLPNAVVVAMCVDNAVAGAVCVLTNAVAVAGCVLTHVKNCKANSNNKCL